MNTENIHRREALKRVSMIMGGALAAPTVLSVMQGCTPQTELTWQPEFFTEDQARTITSVADIILPKTDTPAASELGVPAFIEDIVSNVMKDEDRQAFMTKLEEWNEQSRKDKGETFNDLSSDDQKAFVEDQHSTIKGKFIPPGQRPFIWEIKELVITGYFLTEVAMNQVLQYIAIPTRYDACISLEEAGGKTWAT